ncbi:MAG: linear amide C-N hydrolase [Coxiellaceae bacterium]|nr:linear amide C-N hydrolase [Coxiellaceae bacterium]
MRYLYRIFCLLGLVLLAANSAIACTAVARSYQGQWFSGRNFDWDDGKAFAVVNRPGVERKALSIAKGLKPLQWKSKYGSLTINMAWQGKPNYAAVIDGINQKGLSVSVLELDDTQYPVANPQKPAIGAAMLGQYLMDRYATVAQAVKAVKKLPVVATVYKGKTTPLHFMLNDAGGHTAVIEFLKGKAKIYTGKAMPLRALTNTPYAEALKKWRTVSAQPLVKRWPAGYESMTRFIKAGDFLQVNQVPKTRSGQISMMWVGLSTAAQPPGAQWPTRWQVVRNNTTPQLCFRSTLNQHARCFELSKINFHKAAIPTHLTSE